MKRKLALLLLLILFIAGCSKNEKLIQGMWYTRSQHLNEVSGETYLEVRWIFNNGFFEYHSCCFSGKLHATGRYRILKNEGNKITLELFNVQGDGTIRGGEILITVNEEKGTIKIGGGEDYVRLDKSD
jgi:hypothetical protein